MSIPWTEVWQWCDPTVSLLHTVENCSCHNIEGQFSPACQERRSLLLISNCKLHPTEILLLKETRDYPFFCAYPAINDSLHMCTHNWTSVPPGASAQVHSKQAQALVSQEAPVKLYVPYGPALLHQHVPQKTTWSELLLNITVQKPLKST